MSKSDINRANLHRIQGALNSIYIDYIYIYIYTDEIYIV